MRLNLRNVLITGFVILSVAACRNAAKYAKYAPALVNTTKAVQKWDSKHPTCQTCGGSGEVCYVDEYGNRISENFECPTCEGYGFVSIE